MSLELIVEDECYERFEFSKGDSILAVNRAAGPALSTTVINFEVNDVVKTGLSLNLNESFPLKIPKKNLGPAMSLVFYIL